MKILIIQSKIIEDKHLLIWHQRRIKIFTVISCQSIRWVVEMSMRQHLGQGQIQSELPRVKRIKM